MHKQVKKAFQQAIYPVVLAVAVIAVIGATVYGTSAYLTAKSNSNATTCQNKGDSHVVVIENDQAVPDHTNAKKCDTLTIQNRDQAQRLMAFGQHDHHVAYGGITAKSLGHDGSFTVVLNRAGTFRFHDHYDDAAQGTFTVR